MLMLSFLLVFALIYFFDDRVLSFWHLFGMSDVTAITIYLNVGSLLLLALTMSFLGG